MFLYGKIYKYIVSLALCCIFIYPHIDFDLHSIRITFSIKEDEIKSCAKKTLNVAFYFNVMPPDVGGQIMEFDWITNVLLGEIDRPMKIIYTVKPR